MDLGARVHARQGWDTVAQSVTCGGRREKITKDRGEREGEIFLFIKKNRKKEKTTEKSKFVSCNFALHVALCPSVLVARLGARFWSALMGPPPLFFTFITSLIFFLK